jgi:hypothetical protein
VRDVGLQTQLQKVGSLLPAVVSRLAHMPGADLDPTEALCPFIGAAAASCNALSTFVSRPVQSAAAKDYPPLTATATVGAHLEVRGSCRAAAGSDVQAQRGSMKHTAAATVYMWQQAQSDPLLDAARCRHRSGSSQ